MGKCVHLSVMGIVLLVSLLAMPSLSVAARLKYGLKTDRSARHLLQSSGCARDFTPNAVNYTPVTSVCSPSSPTGADATCCAAFNKLACEYSGDVNNMNSACPLTFLAYLSSAGPYQTGYFVTTCTSGEKGLCGP